MKVTNRSILTGKENTVDLDITQEQMDAFLNGAKVQHAFPNLTPDEREFLLFGVIPDEG